MKKEKNKFSVKKRLKSFVYAYNGIKYFLSSQHNAWIHLAAATLVVFFGFYFNLNKTEWLFVIVSMAFVFVAEIFNSSIEALTNLVSPDYNEKAGRIKDLAAAAVLVSAITSAIIGCYIFLPKIYNLF